MESFENLKIVYASDAKPDQDATLWDWSDTRRDNPQYSAILADGSGEHRLLKITLVFHCDGGHWTFRSDDSLAVPPSQVAR